MKNIALLTIILFNFIASSAFAQKKPIKGPIFSQYGPVYKVADSAFALEKNFVYKVVFNIDQSSTAPEQLNRKIESIARFINMHALNGVSLKNMQLAAVFHGQATRDLLNDKTYHQKYGRDNPNLDLEEQLRAKGVKFYLCGQSMNFAGYHKNQLQHPDDLALSAMTMFTVLQSKGYQLIP